MKKTTNKIKNFVATILAFAMMISVFSASAPTKVQAADMSFKGKGTSTLILTGNETLPQYYVKFKAGVTGTITLTFANTSKGFAEGEMQLLNGKKKPLTSMEEWRSVGPEYHVTKTFGVKKGKTYYFWFEAGNDVQVKASVKAVKKYNCNSMKKAKTIKKGKKVTSVLIAGEKKSDWYKVKLNKRTHLRLIIEAITNGESADALHIMNGDGPQFKISFYDSKGKPLKIEYGSCIMTTWERRQGISIVAPKGTLYIKMQDNSGETSGQYSILWKK